jgi:predicted alpha/beta-hydrolase family hydrolase
MKRKSLTIKVSADIGKVSGIITTPAKPNCVLTIAHGAGAGMNHPFMEELATTLADAGIASMRFNFPFMENKKGRPDTPAVAHKTIEAVILKARKLYPALPLFASGKSFGGRMTSQYVSAGTETNVSGLIFFGFPLHAPGKPSIERGDHLKKIKIPMLFLQGSRDEFAEWDLIKKVCASLKTAKLVRIEGANHGFKAGKLNTMEILVNQTKTWIESILKKSKTK